MFVIFTLDLMFPSSKLLDSPRLSLQNPGFLLSISDKKLKREKKWWRERGGGEGGAGSGDQGRARLSRGRWQRGAAEQGGGRFGTARGKERVNDGGRRAAAAGGRERAAASRRQDDALQQQPSRSGSNATSGGAGSGAGVVNDVEQRRGGALPEQSISSMVRKVCQESNFWNKNLTSFGHIL
ncbi:hypothetical protein Scep_030961 [Stephania cephalantha]|uniref:Uncharacterized protein n=1 Tax=Stephania cephalantha TaxID=152367 RepID=A0AAP0E0M6_9MAGN